MLLCEFKTNHDPTRDDIRMEMKHPGEPFQDDPQEKAKEFDALWELSKLRAECRRGLSLEELKYISSRMRRMARLSVVPEQDSASRRGGRYDWPANSRKAG